MNLKKSVGNFGEDSAASFLASKGYEIVERQWRSRSGEIDIIAKDGGVLVFVEVKTWPKGCPESLERALGVKKQKRILETAKSFLQNNRKYVDSLVRFDVLLVDVPGFPEIYQIENAFSEIE